MADQKISDDASITGVAVNAAADFIPIVDVSEVTASDRNKKIIPNELAIALGAELLVNKENTTLDTSTTKYPTNRLVKEYVDAAALAIVASWKAPVKVASTGSLTLSGEQTIDGVLTSASRILVKDQSTASQNGIYVTGAGAWSRSADANTAAELEGAAVTVQEGTTNGNTTWLQTTDNITLGSSSIAWSQLGTSVSDASETVKGIVEEATDAETIAGTATGGTSAKLFVTPAKLLTWFTATKLVSAFYNWVFGIVAEAAATHTFVLTDSGKIIRSSNAGTSTFTIPTNASIAYPVGSWIEFERTHASASTILAPAGGVTFVTDDASNLTIRKQYGKIRVIKVATDTWHIQHTSGSWWEFAKTQTASITAQWTITGTDNSSATYSFIVKNLAGDVILQTRNDQATEFGGTSFLLEVATGVATGNARFRVNGNLASAMVCEDKDGQVYWELRATTGDKAMVFSSRVEQNQGLGFTRVIKQFYLRLPNQTAATAHIVDQISIPSDTVVQISIDNFAAVATDGATVELVAGQQSIVRNIAGTTSKASSTYTVLGNPATTALLSVVANNTNDRADLTFTNTVGTGKDFEVYGSVSYILKAVPV